MKKNDLALRLSVKGREELLSTMKDMGGEYAKAAKKIESGSKEANAALKGVNTAVKEGKGALEDYAQRGGVLGRMLKDIGPAGLLAGASIGAITVALGGAMKVAREAVKAFDEIGKSADTLQLSTDALQSLKAAATDEGVAFTDVEGAVRSLTKAHSDLVLGSGELYTRLKDTNPQLLEMLRNTTSNDERLRILTGALQSAQTQTEKNNIAYAAFGESGLGVARMLERQQGGVDGMIAKYREMGLVVREDVIRNAEDMETQFGVAAQVVDLQLKQAFIDLAPALIGGAQLLADFATVLGGIVELTRDLENRSSRMVEKRAGDLFKNLERLGYEREQIEAALNSGEAPDFGGGGGTYGDLRNAQAAAYFRELEEVYRVQGVRAEEAFQDEAARARQRLSAADLAARKRELQAQLAEEGRIIADARSVQDKETLDAATASRRAAAIELAGINEEIARRAGMPAAKDPQAEAAAAAAAKAREAELNRMRTEAIALQKSLGDYTAYLANETARYQKLLDEGLITPQQYAAAVKNMKDELTGVTAAMDLWKGMVEAARTPVEVITDQMDQLDADLAAGKITIDLYREALFLLTGELAKAGDAADQAAPGYKDAETIRAELEKAAFDALSPAEKLRKEQERIKVLVDAGQLDPSAATEWLVLYKKRLDEAAGSMGLLAAGERLLDDIQKGRIRTWGDLKRAIGDLLIETVKNYLAAQTAMQGGSGQGGLLEAIFSFGKGIFQNGGWGGSSPNVGASHSGGLGSNPQQTRRLGSGRLGNERLQFIREDEEVLTSYGKMNIAAQVGQLAAERAAMSGLVSRVLMASAAPSMGPMKVSINNYAGAEIETSQREGPEGPEMSIDVRGKMKEMARGGVFDGPFKERYGLVPNT